MLVSKTLRPVLQSLCAAALFGAAVPASKVVLSAIGPITTAGLLYLGAAIAVAPSAWRNRQLLRTLNRRDLVRFASAALIGGGVAPVLAMLALARSPAAVVSLWLSLEVVFTGVVAALFFGEYLGPRAWLANAIVFLGSALLAFQGELALGAGALLAGAACVGWAVDNNLAANVTQVSPTQFTFFKGAVAGVVNLAIWIALEPHPLPPKFVLGGFVVGALGYGVSIVLYVRGARELGAARSQMLFATAPFIGAFLSWLALGESLGAIQLIAAAIMASGLALLLFERHDHAHAHLAHEHTHEHRHDDGHHTHQHPGIPASTRHSHVHRHDPVNHTHPHGQDEHHRHRH